MPTYRDGQTATDKSGRKVRYNAATDSWEAVPGTGRRALTKAEEKVLNELNAQAASAAETRNQVLAARQASRRLRPGPYRGMFLDAAIPEEGGGILDRVGALVVGAPASLLGAIDQQDVEDYTTLKGIGSERVLEEQIKQKGPQTESDAARLAATEISRYKPDSVNLEKSNRSLALSDRVERRARFYTEWAHKYGLNGLDPQGRSVEEAFQQAIANAPKPDADVLAKIKRGGWKLLD